MATLLQELKKERNSLKKMIEEAQSKLEAVEATIAQYAMNGKPSVNKRKSGKGEELRALFLPVFKAVDNKPLQRKEILELVAKQYPGRNDNWDSRLTVTIQAKQLKRVAYGFYIHPDLPEYTSNEPGGFSYDHDG